MPSRAVITVFSLVCAVSFALIMVPACVADTGGAPAFLAQSSAGPHPAGEPPSRTWLGYFGTWALFWVVTVLVLLVVSAWLVIRWGGVAVTGHFRTATYPRRAWRPRDRYNARRK